MGKLDTDIPALDAMGAVTVTRFTPFRTPIGTGDLVRNRVKANKQAGIEVGDNIRTNVADFTVIAPGTVKTMPGGRLLQAMLGKRGIDLDDGVWVNYAPWGGRSGLDQALIASYASIALVVGNDAWRMYHPKVKLQHVHGTGVIHHTAIGDVMLFPIYHPDSLVKDKSQRDKHELDIYLFSEMVRDGEEDITCWLGEKCGLCGRGFVCWDEDGIPYCEEHWDGEQRRGKAKLGEQGARITGPRKKAFRKGRNLDPNQPTLG